MKPIYKIIIAVIIAVLLGFGAYFIWSRFFVPTPTPQETQPSGTVEAPSQGSTQTTSGAPVSGGANKDIYTFKKLSDAPALGFWISKTTGSVFYIATSGIVMEAKDGADVEVSKQGVSRFINLDPSPSGERVLVSSGNPDSPQWSLFDSIDKVWRPLPKELVNVTWAGSESQLVGVVQLNNTLSLSFINIAKQPYGYKTIVPNFNMLDVVFSAKSSTELLISEKTSSYSSSRIWQLDTKTGIMTLVTSPAFGSFVRWSNNKDVLFRFSSPSKFSILDRTFSEIVPTLLTTLPSKCDGGTDVVYCFVPKDTNAFSRTRAIPDDYFMNKLYTSDDLHKVDLRTGNDSAVVVGEAGSVPALDADNVIYVNSSIYFMNKYDNYVYAVEHKSNEIINDY